MEGRAKGHGVRLPVSALFFSPSKFFLQKALTNDQKGITFNLREGESLPQKRKEP